MSKRNGSRFKLLEVEGYSEREIYEGEELEDMYEFLEAKTGDVEFTFSDEL